MANDTKVAIPGRVSVENLIEGLNYISHFPVAENKVIKQEIELKEYKYSP